MSSEKIDSDSELLTRLQGSSCDDVVELASAALARAADQKAQEISELDQLVARLLADPERGPACAGGLELEQLGRLAERFGAALGPENTPEPTVLHQASWHLLDGLRSSSLLGRIAASEDRERWAERILQLVERSHFSFGRLLEQRCRRYGDKGLFILTDGRTLSYSQVWQRSQLMARALLALGSGTDHKPIAVLSRNRIEMALADFACLAAGIVNVMIPATATEADVEFILGHAEVGAVLTADEDLVAKAVNARRALGSDLRILRLDNGHCGDGVEPFEKALDRAGDVPVAELERRRNSVRIDRLASIMYTSGTTGTPKGIAFSHRNMVFKRFARAMALPEIGDNDRLLCYLPLFHTFGRFLELQGSVFWGATYCFAENPGIETLVRQMTQLRPTVFISIPMKWMQLYEMVQQKVDLRVVADDELNRVTRSLVGGRLRWGLSAAGYLDPEVFRFFQSQGIELMSGFGMTEATGGITMTPPGQYRDDSLGVALPGIELKLADDGELMIKGPYVTEGYYRPVAGTPEFDADGWLHTGDLMERDEIGHLHIVDRKKEIYKNVKGQTVAPQRVENLFRDFEQVGSVFLVGDHRPYNTALIFPNPEFSELDFQSLAPEERKSHFRSLVVTANSFLAPYERIVDFAVIERDFSAEFGELTPKGTYRRKAIEKNFADTIRLLYRRATLHVGGAELTVENWLFQALGFTAEDLSAQGEELRFSPSGTRLLVRRVAPDEVLVGSAVYRCRTRTLGLGALLSTPQLWLGNQELVDFAPIDNELRDRHRRREVATEWLRREPGGTEAPDRLAEQAATLIRKQDFELMDLHQAALLLDSEDTAQAELAVRVLRHVVELEDSELASTARSILRRAATATTLHVARQAFEVLAVTEIPHSYRDTVARFLDVQPGVLDGETAEILGENELSAERLEAFLGETERRCSAAERSEQEIGTVRGLLRLLARYGTSHPSQYRRLRAFFTRIAMTAQTDELRHAARLRRGELETGFRSWIGAPTRVAVDPETGFEYRWDDVAAFSDEVEEKDRQRLMTVLRSTSLLREAVFLFGNGAAVRLHDILPGGVWVRLLGSDHGKTVYRIAVRTRDRGTFDLAVNLNQELSPAAIEEEVDWLILCGDPGHRSPLVEDFGGYWPEHGLWSEEFIAGETLDRALGRLSRRAEDEDRFRGVWYFASWTAMSRYVDFWNRTGRRLEIADPRPANVIVPTHDYHTGARLVSISNRRPFASLAQMLFNLKQSFITQIEAAHSRLDGLVGWDTVFSALFEVVGEEDGLQLLSEAMADMCVLDAAMADAARDFVEVVERRGFLPLRLFFACKRYRRWQRLNSEATHFARARTLHEIYVTYDLQQLAESYPEARARYFRETVFADSGGELASGLDEIIAALRRGDTLPGELSMAVAELRAHLHSETEEDFFLARLSFPHLRPEDEAGYVAVTGGDGQQSEMVVTIEDTEGAPFRIRHALNPKEVGRLHRLFLAAKLPVQFRPEHRFLVALSERGHIIGGLFYELQKEERNAHMDKIVVDDPFRRRGVAGALIEELCSRLQSADYRSLTTGFFRPQFFYRYGFSVERRYAGLVRNLEQATGTEPPQPEVSIEAL